MKTRKMIARLAVLLVLISSSYAQQIPSLINYQGQLSNPDGTPVATADYELSFSIFDADQAGTRVWGPQVFNGQSGQGYGARIPVVQGYFNAVLGPTDTGGRSLANAFDGSVRFVEITVAGRSPIAPRQQLLSAPFALRSANSERLAGYDWGSLLNVNDPVNGKLAGGKIATDSITGSQIANDTIGSAELGNGAVTAAKLADGQVVTRAVQDGAIVNSKVADGQIDGRTLANGSVSNPKILDGAVTAAKIAGSSIALSHLQGAVLDALVPPGTIIAFGGATPPAGWLLCDGSAISRSSYSVLYSAIGTGWGYGDGGSTFNVPDLRGLFARGVDGSAGRDPDKSSRTTSAPGGNSGNSVGSVQLDEIKGHQHATPGWNGVTIWGDEANQGENVAGYYNNAAYPKSLTKAFGGSESRPKNAYVNYIIKY